jgi:2,4-diacetylphloroglucinol hydrolase
MQAFYTSAARCDRVIEYAHDSEDVRAMTRACPVTYFPVATQQQYRLNYELIQDKPYARYFNADLWLHEDVLPALQQPMDPRHALAPEQINSLLDPGYHEVETGYCELADGSAYTASLVPFPGCSGEMYGWWFWWHAVEPARYTLWYPHNHVSVRSLDPAALVRPGLSHAQRYIGTTHHVDEYIGHEFMRVAIRFVDPAELGFDTTRFERAGIVGHACARVGIRGTGVEVVSMVHLARKTATGIEQRSRYWMGHDPRLKTPLGSIGLTRMMKPSITRRLAGARIAYEQLLHDQIEFTHLSTFLPELYREYGSAPAAHNGPAAEPECA